MRNFLKLGITISCILFFSGITCFAQQNDLLDISTPESSKLVREQNGLISSSQMQAYQGEKTSQTIKAGNVSKKRMTIKKTVSPKQNIQATGK